MSHSPQLQQSLSAATFRGGRRSTSTLSAAREQDVQYVSKPSTLDSSVQVSRGQDDVSLHCTRCSEGNSRRIGRTDWRGNHHGQRPDHKPSLCRQRSSVRASVRSAKGTSYPGPLEMDRKELGWTARWHVHSGSHPSWLLPGPRYPPRTTLIPTRSSRPHSPRSPRNACFSAPNLRKPANCLPSAGAIVFTKTCLLPQETIPPGP